MAHMYGGKTDPCVSELNWRGENVNDLGDELPEGAANCVENTAIRKTHERQTQPDTGENVTD